MGGAVPLLPKTPWQKPEARGVGLCTGNRNRMRGNGPKVPQGRVRLDIRENSVQKVLSSPVRGCPGQCGVTSPGRAQKRFGSGT